MKDFMTEYIQREQQIRSMDFEHMTEADFLALEQYGKDKNFITDIQHSVTFLEETTGYVIGKSIIDDPEFKGVLPEDKLLESYKVLSCGGNNRFLNEFVRENSFQISEELQDGSLVYNTAEKNYIEENNLNSRDTLCKYVRDDNAVISAESDNCILFENKQYSKEDLEREIIKVKELAKEYGVDIDKDYGKAALFNEALKKGELITYDLSEENKEKNNAVVEETTIDPAVVSDKVKLETVSDVGTKERKQIDAGHGVDADIDKIADQAPSYEPQTDRAAIRKSSYDMERD